MKKLISFNRSFRACKYRRFWFFLSVFNTWYKLMKGKRFPFQLPMSQRASKESSKGKEFLMQKETLNFGRDWLRKSKCLHHFRCILHQHPSEISKWEDNQDSFDQLVKFPSIINRQFNQKNCSWGKERRFFQSTWIAVQAHIRNRMLVILRSLNRRKYKL